MPTASDLIKNFKKIKTLPHVAINLSQLISKENSTIKEIENIIKLDPTLVLRVLRLVNSPYYGLRQKVDNISKAVIYIGLENLRNMIVVDALKDLFKDAGDGDIFSREKLWLHCAVVAICGQMIAERIFRKKGEDLFLCGILHDIGMIIEEQAEHDLFISVINAYKPNTKTITDYEKDIIGTDHCLVGNQVIIEWKLPLEVQKGIKDHHKVSPDITPESITGMIQISEYLTGKLQYGIMPNMTVMLSPLLLKHISDNIDEYKVLLKDLPDELSKAKEIYKLD
ncbi:MAG: HDOD domain-containing protein [Desulfobacterales bacterium]|nr:HDOD domain-containing protein [Desulfobacterales bacterium]